MALDPELKKHFDAVMELSAKVHPHFNKVNSFVAMMTLADIVAQWILSHPPERQGHVVSSLIASVQDRLEQLIDQDYEETRH